MKLVLAPLHNQLTVAIARFGAMLSLFLFLTWLGMEFFALSTGMTTIKPICGVALAIAIIQGRNAIWQVALAIFISGLAARLMFEEQFLTALWGTAMVALSVIGTFFAVRRTLGPSPDFSIWKQLIRYMMISAGISVAVGVIFPLPFVLLGGQEFWPYWNVWWLPTGLSFILFTPAIVLVAKIDHKTIARIDYGFIGALLLLAAAIASNFVHLPFPQPVLIPLAMFVLVLVSGIEGAAVGLILTMTALVIGVMTGQDVPAVDTWSLGVQLIMIQALLAVMTVILLPAGATITARRKLQGELVQMLSKEERISAALRAKEQDLRLNEARYRLLAENASDVIVQVNMDSKIAYASPATERLFGRASLEMVGQPGIDWVVKEDRFKIMAARQELLSSEDRDPVVTMQYRVRHKDGHVVWVENRQTLVRDTEGQPQSFIGVVRDVSKQKAIEDELIRARDQANAANRAKADFLANMSHELRTPLNAILGFSEILATQLYGPLGQGKYVEYAEDVHKSGAHLLELINDVLDLSKIDAGKIELHESTFSVSEVVDDAVLLARGRAKNNVRLEVGVPADIHMQADKRLTKQILINILSNAIKFTPAGGTISVDAKESDEGWEIVVADTGVGMDAAQLEKAFSPYGQVNSHIAQVHQGTGLGLPIARSLARLQGGDIIAQSTPGYGTRMVLILPKGRTVEQTGVPRFESQGVR